MGTEELPQDRIIAKFKEEFEKTFPEFPPIISWGYGIDFHLSNDLSNYSFRKSNYFIDPSDRTFFHLTNYNGFYSIINSGNIRMYNLLNSEDKNELDSYAEAGLTEESIKNIKESIFTFSFCDVSAITDNKLWEEYGKVAIVFEVVNDCKKWHGYHCSNAFYERGRFKEYFELQKQFANQYKTAFRFESLSKLIAFHKIPSLNWEKEIRLLYIPHLNDIREEGIYDDFKTSEYHSGQTKYVELPLVIDGQRKTYFNRLWLRLTDKTTDDKPKIKIKSIIFGDNDKYMDQQKYKQSRLYIEDYLDERLGYPVEINRELYVTGAPKT